MTAPLSLYIHIPFCDHRCAYCDFNAYAGLDHLMEAYTAALVAEIGWWGDRLGRRRVPTVFFGGGTPSRLPLPLLAQVIGAVRSAFAVEADAEWSLEANPGTVDASYFRGLAALGVNRLSIGTQSFDDTELLLLDRIHDGATAEAAFHAARAAGFPNISLDLIFGLEGQTLAGWERNVRRAVALGPEHLSLYALTIEEGTPLAHRVARGSAPEPDGDLQADMYEQAQTILTEAGYEQYEISNWSRPGLACRHNLVYWRDGEWLGLGAGAHSHLDGLRFAVVNSPAGYIRGVGGPNPLAPFPTGKGELLGPGSSYPVTESVTSQREWATGARGEPFGSPLLAGEGQGEGLAAGPSSPTPSASEPPMTPAPLPVTGEGGPPQAGQVRATPPALPLSPDSLRRLAPWLASVEQPDVATAMTDAAVLALRLREGLDLAAFANRFGMPFDAAFPAVQTEMTGYGLLESANGRLRLTERGLLLANEVFSRLTLAAEQAHNNG